MVSKQDRVRPRTGEALERKYRGLFDDNAQRAARGKDGRDGITPHIDDESGHWFVGLLDTGIPARGENGVGIVKIEKIVTVGLVDTYKIVLDDDSIYTFTVTNGTDGRDGTDGQDGYTPVKGVDYFDGTDGHTPYIQDGYWYINGNPTGVKAEGKDGESGIAFETDKTLSLLDGVLSVNTATEADRELPIKAVDVDVIVGNIEVLLETI